MTDYRYALTVTLLEDLHSGTGTGTLIVDRLQARDEQGWPVIPRSHFKGVLRDNARRLARLGVLDEAFIERVFGAAGNRRGQLECRSLRLQSPVDTLTWDATARRVGSRVPEDDSLRRTEYVPAGTTFTGEMLLYNADEKQRTLLNQVLRFTDRLGSERTRGSGLIRLQSTSEPIARQATAVTSLPQPTSHRCLRLLLCNDEPLCLPRTGFPGNIIDSETFIPGRVLFGALCHWALQNQPERSQLPLLFRRQFAIGNAYPLPRGLASHPAEMLATITVYPMPLNLYSAKSGPLHTATAPTTHSAWPHWCDSKPLAHSLKAGRDHRVIHDVLRAADKDSSTLTLGKRPKPNRYLCAFSPCQWWLYDLELALQMRNQRGAPTGEVKRAETALFSVEQIPAGTHFVADIAYADDAPLSEFLELYDELLQQRAKLKIGRGGAPLTVVAAQFLPTLPSPPPAQNSGDSASLQITLTSDLIARDRFLRFHQQLSIAMLQDVLGADAGHWGAIRTVGAKSDYEIVRTFNASSGLPRAPVGAIRRGSVLRLQGDVQALREHLMQNTALGERVWEGHGRFLLDHYPLDEALDDTEPERFKPLSSIDSAIGEQEAILQQATDYYRQLGRKSSLPSRSQLGQLLDVVRSFPNAPDRALIRQRLAPFEQAARKKSGQAWQVLFSSTDPQRDLREQLPANARHAQRFIELLISLAESVSHER